ncbi:MAG TPA: hypothetical protein VIJ84_04735 [Gaiellaceae bacterium]
MSRNAALASVALLFSILLVLPSSGLSSSQVPLPTLYRMHTFKLNLDRDAAREQVQVYDLRQGAMMTPTTYFRVGDRRSGTLVNIQLQQVFLSPGSSESGLVQAWVRDLNGDNRAEIAVRDYATPSVGETLTVYRQRKPNSLRFSKLQTIAGDQILIARRNAPATWNVLIRANHAPDGRDHHELWRWAPAQKKWVCGADCVPR